MRTVSFSQPQTRRYLNQNFVNTFNNTTGGPTSGKSIWHQPGDPSGTCIRGNGKHNVQTLFLTPSGNIFHVATGFLSSEDLLAESKFAFQLFHKLNQAPQIDDNHVVEAHRNRLESVGYPGTNVQQANPLVQMMKQGFPQAGGNVIKGVPFLGSTKTGNVLDLMIRQQFFQDQKFSMQYPLMSWEQFERDPTTLAGNGQSFFSSSSSGSRL